MWFPFSVNWVTVDGILYKKPCAIVIELGEDAKLMGIYTTNFKDIRFDLIIFHTLEFDHHSYIVEPTSHTLSNPLILIFIDIRVLPKTTGTLCVVPHHFVRNYND